jgi:hypothetical protein
MKKHYKTLGLQEGATHEEVQEAYHRLSKELNPVNNDNQEFFKEEYKKVQEAYEALSNSRLLAEAKGLKTSKNITSKPINTDSKSSKKSPPKSPKNNFTKQNITILFLFFSIVLNVYTFIQVKGDNNAITITEGYMNQAKEHMEQTRQYMSNAENYSDDAEWYMSQAEEYMNYAEEYMNNAYNYMVNSQ